MNNDFADFEKTLNAMAANLKPAKVAQISRNAATALKQSNARRLAQNIEPSGEKFTPRTKKKLFRPQTTATFLYPSGGNSTKRLVNLTSWTVRGNSIIGYNENVAQNEPSFVQKSLDGFLIAVQREN